MRNKQVEFNPYIYTLSKLSRFGYEISVFEYTTGWYSEQPPEQPAHTSRLSLHGKMDVKIFLMFIVAVNTRSVNIDDWFQRILISLFSDRALCLSFVYSMFGRKMGSLRVTQVKNDLTNILFFRIGDKGSDWQSAKVNSLSDGLSKVTFIVGKPYHG